MLDFIFAALHSFLERFDGARLGKAGGSLVDLDDEDCDTRLSLFRFFVRWDTDNAGSLVTLEETL